MSKYALTLTLSVFAVALLVGDWWFHNTYDNSMDCDCEYTACLVRKYNPLSNSSREGEIMGTWCNIMGDVHTCYEGINEYWVNSYD